MSLRSTHTTTYMYSDPVSICHTEVHLTPRADSRQTLLEHHIDIAPAPDLSLSREDYFGNKVKYFSIHEPHQTLTITAQSLLELPAVTALEADLTPAWERVREEVQMHSTRESFDAFQYIFESPRIQCGPEFAAYARLSFTPGRPILEAARHLSGRIFEEFRYDQRATTVTTPVAEVLKKRQGVCQDFAHFMLACLRSLGLPARYVSGYLLGNGKNIGAEASHAWASVYCPQFDWLDFDPTNNVLPSDHHITVAWGRDYSDVTPVKGVAHGGGDQVITVEVEVVSV